MMYNVDIYIYIMYNCLAIIIVIDCDTMYVFCFLKTRLYCIVIEMLQSKYSKILQSFMTPT